MIEKIDPATGKPEVPIFMFDQLIVDAGRFANDVDPFAAHDAAKGSVPEVPEVEIYEYRQLVEQLAWMKQHYPNVGVVNGLKVPMVSGPEVITCDNTTFVTTRLDADRSGVTSSAFRGQLGAVVGGDHSRLAAAFDTAVSWRATQQPAEARGAAS